MKICKTMMGSGQVTGEEGEKCNCDRICDKVKGVVGNEEMRESDRSRGQVFAK